MRFIIANWKSNMDLAQVNNWLKKFEEVAGNMEFKNKILLAPPFPYLQIIKKYTIFKKNVEPCSQDVSIYEPGAHTGEVNSQEVADFCKYSIIGHSERNEPQETVVKKLDACLRAGITPIACFVTAEQLENYTSEHTLTGNILYASEDPQNISRDGKYQIKSSGEIQNGFNILRAKFPNAQILYGGSVNITNAKSIAEMRQVAGVLIGHASLDPKHFLDIIIEFERNPI